MAFAPPSPVDLSKAFETGQFSDLTIRCQDKDFPAHRAIVLFQSKVLQAACGAGFEASTTGILNLSEHDAEHVWKMLHFLYNSTYPSSIKDFPLHVEMYAIGAKYDIRRLCKYAKAKYKEVLPSGVNEVVLSLIPRIYESTPDSDRGFRDIMVLHVRQYYDSYSKHEELKAKLDEVLQSTWLFAKDMLASFAAHPFAGKCGNCGPQQTTRISDWLCLKCGDVF